jgi:hypothetical protein
VDGPDDDDGDARPPRRPLEPVHGQESFHGDQDNDPAANSDCRTGAPLATRATEVHAAEVQVWSSKPDVDGAVVDG